MLRRGILTSQPIRTVTLAAEKECLDRPAEAASTPGYLTSIEDIDRSVDLLTTLRRAELTRDKCKKQLDSVLNDGRLAMAESLGEVANANPAPHFLEMGKRVQVMAMMDDAKYHQRTVGDRDPGKNMRWWR